MLLDAPRYRKHPALIAPRTLLAVSEDVVTDAPTITPTKLVQATEIKIYVGLKSKHWNMSVPNTAKTRISETISAETHRAG